MTAPSGSILFNSSTGSDSDASGLGPATAVVGSSAELDGTSTVDLSYDGMDLSGISAGDLLYCSTSSGRQFSIIASVDTLNETVTTDEAWPTESGVSWAVGGKRATLQNSQYLWIKNDGAGGGLTYELETDQTMSSYVVSYSGMGGSIKSSVAGTKRTITLGSSYFAEGGGWSCYDIHFKSTATAYLGRASTSTQNSTWTLYDCIVGDSTDQFLTMGTRQSRTLTIRARRTIFQNFSSATFQHVDTNLTYCIIRDQPTQRAFHLYSTSSAGHRAKHCIFTNLHSVSYQRRSQGTDIQNCVIEGMVSTGNLITYSDNAPGNVIENIFVNNAGPVGTWTSSRMFGNAYYSSGTIPTQDTDPITLTADPFTDAANEDFSLNNDTGGGAVLRAKKQTVSSTDFHQFNWLTDGSGGSGGGSTFHSLAQ